MGSKSGSAITIDKKAVAFYVTTLWSQSRKIDELRADITAHVKALEGEPELLQGDRAELYQEYFQTMREYAEKAAENAVTLRKVAQDKNDKLNLGVDFKRVDAAAQENLSKAKAIKARKLKGQ